jgi:mannitol/fructose-specific phosphotransferase system IIA component (Ntr-type)
MSYARYLSEESVRLDLSPVWDDIVETQETEPEEVENEFSEEDDGECVAVKKKFSKAAMRQIKDAVMRDMAQLLYASGKIPNCHKLTTDLINVERRSTSAVGSGVVLPHVRCLHTTNLIMGFARYTPEFDFDAPDEQDVHLFIPMVAPLYDDRQYLRIYRSIAKAFLETDVKQRLLEVQYPGEVIRIFNEYFV